MPNFLSSSCDRRQFLSFSLTASLGACAGGRVLGAPEVRGRRSGAGLIDSIEKVTLRRGRNGGTTWFHPRACMVPGAAGAAPTALMTLQSIGGSDYFGPVHWTESADLGQTWTEPQPIPALGRENLPDRSQVGVCDVVPEYHPPTQSVLALGHNVFYKNGRFFRQQPPRRAVYVVRRKDGTWSERKPLLWDDSRGTYIYTNNCGQRVTRPDGDVLFVMSFGASPSAARSAASALCAFDGQTLRIKTVGPELTHAAGRGLLEPSVTFWGGQYYVTLRAEDDRGYVAVSQDGLEWGEKQPWCWDDGEPLTMSTTQQHWLTHSDGLYLVYTRKHPSNANVIRWRSPLFLAEVDRERMRLVRDTERVVLPLVGDGINDPDHVALMGNFHVVNASPEESWVTVGEWMPRAGARGDMLLARIRWNRPNRLATGVRPDHR